MNIGIFRKANVAEIGIKIESQTKKKFINSPLFKRRLIKYSACS